MVAYEGSEPFVFVSYSHKDKNKVLPLVEGLQNRGFRVWYDEGIEVGFDWTESIAKHLSRSSCVLAFVSRNFDASHNCRREINFAIKKRKEPMVIYMEDEELLSEGMQMQLCPLHAMYLDNYANNESFLDVLSKAALLQPCLGKAAAPAKPADITAEQRSRVASVERKREVVFSTLFGLVEQKYGKGAAAPAKSAEPSVEELYKKVNGDIAAMAAIILEGLGGKDNVVSIDNCTTRLRLELKNRLLVDERKIKSAGAAGITRPGKTSVHVIIGSDVQFIAEEFKKLCK